MHNSVNQIKENRIKRFIIKGMFFMTFFIITQMLVARDQRHKASYYVSRAESFIHSNAWTAAKREIDNGLEEWPDDADLRFLNGRYYYITKHLNEARYNLIRAIQTNDQHYKAKRTMVDVEDDSKHYSSAICYINELLEFQPYDRDLWRRKISLYRKLHNNVEADAALERLARIYPNDSLVRNDLLKQRRKSIDKLIKKSNIEQVAIELEEWIGMDPDNLSYYIELMGIYLRMGDNDRAIGIGNRGLERFPNNAELTNKIIGILTEMGNYSQALKIARKNPSSIIYTNLLQEAAVDARIHDPYEMNGRLYAETHDRDALNYLINTSLTRGYFDDARVYINDAIQHQGRTTPLLMKLYTLEKRMGNENAMRRILQELYLSNPNNEELKENYAEMMLHLGTTDMAQQQWAEANKHFQSAIELIPVGHESWPSAVSMLIICLGHQNKIEEAKQLFKESASIDFPNKQRYASAYEDIMVNRLNILIEEENHGKALSEAQELLKEVPNSETALRCCINMSQTLKYEDLFQKYAEMGYMRFPDSPYFVIKQAISLHHQNRHAEALELVNPSNRKEGEYESPQYIAAHSSITGEWVKELLKSHMPEIAMQIIDTALSHNSANKELLYMKGVAYELLKDFNKAYAYQKQYYEPSNAEQAEYYEHMNYLGFRALKNRIDTSYTQAFYNNHSENSSTRAHLYSIASISYSRNEDKNTYTGQISYKGIDGYHNNQDYESGGIGLEFMAQMEHSFNHRLNGMVNVALSTKYFNKAGANISASYTMDHEWTPSLRIGYRRTPKTFLYMSMDENTTEAINNELNLFIITPSIEKSWELIRTTINIDLIAMKSSLYYNVGVKGKLFFNNDNISSVSLLTGFGSFPELTFFEQTALHNISHTNAMVGFDVQYMLTRHLYLGLAGNWNTSFTPYIDNNGKLNKSYRNIYGMTIQAHMAF